MFVWLVHRISGVLLIVVLGLKIFTAFFLMTKGMKPDWALILHTNRVIDTFLIVAIVYHAFYGLRTLLIDLGSRKEKLLFWVFTASGTACAVALLVLYYTRNY